MRFGAPSSVSSAIGNSNKEGTMRRVTHLHRTLTVFLVVLLALALPLVALANSGGPNGS